MFEGSNRNLLSWFDNIVFLFLLRNPANGIFMIIPIDNSLHDTVDYSCLYWSQTCPAKYCRHTVNCIETVLIVDNINNKEHLECELTIERYNTTRGVSSQAIVWKVCFYVDFNCISVKY